MTSARSSIRLETACPQAVRSTVRDLRRTAGGHAVFSVDRSARFRISKEPFVGREREMARSARGRAPRTCDQLIADKPSGMALAASVNIFDVQGAGDIAFNFFLGCE